MTDYFVKVWVKTKEKDGEDEILIKYFLGENELFDWMQDNKNALYSIYEAKCVLDYS